MCKSDDTESGREQYSRASSLEELAMLRDMKRRRAKYKVSTKSKSYTEIMKSVIGNLVNIFLNVKIVYCGIL